MTTQNTRLRPVAAASQEVGEAWRRVAGAVRLISAIKTVRCAIKRSGRASFGARLCASANMSRHRSRSRGSSVTAKLPLTNKKWPAVKCLRARVIDFEMDPGSHNRTKGALLETLQRPRLTLPKAGLLRLSGFAAASRRRFAFPGGTVVQRRVGRNVENNSPSPVSRVSRTQTASLLDRLQMT
jgi:hypothetical protein